MKTAPALHVLLIEDQDADAELLSEAALIAGLSWEIVHVRDGEAALAALETGAPQLILTDLHVQGMDGHTFLELLHGDARWQAVPVVVLSGSMREADRQRSLDRHASAVCLKPDHFQGYLDLARELDQRWGSAGRAAPLEASPPLTGEQA